jgi:hypothetical protein
MIITEETKKRFVSMLVARQILVIECHRNPKDRHYEYKFIGANEKGKWDFTPMIEEVTDFKSNKPVPIKYLTIHANDAAHIVANTLEKFDEEGVFPVRLRGVELYQYVRDLLTTFNL